MFPSAPQSLFFFPGLWKALTTFSSVILGSSASSKHAPLCSSSVQGLFKALAGHLRTESDRQGQAPGRLVHMMLEALALRVTKKGALAVNAKPPRMTLQVCPPSSASLCPWLQHPYAAGAC